MQDPDSGKTGASVIGEQDPSSKPYYEGNVDDSTVQEVVIQQQQNSSGEADPSALYAGQKNITARKIYNALETYVKDSNGKTYYWSNLKDANGNRILDEEGDYSGYFRDIQWKNKAITELYYPGSVFKVITSAMGVDSGLANINTTFTCAGAYGVAKETYHCAGHKAHGTITLAEALRQSCNIYYLSLIHI